MPLFIADLNAIEAATLKAISGVRPGDEYRFHIHDRIARDDAGPGGFAEALLDWPEVFAWQSRACNFRFKLQAFSGRERFESERAITELAVTTCLTYQLALRGGRFCDGLTVGDPGGADGGIDIKFPSHSFDYDLEVKFAHSGKDDLAALFVARNDECRVFVGEPEQGSRHFFLVAARLRLHSH